jgi:PKD repeat protein
MNTFEYFKNDIYTFDNKENFITNLENSDYLINNMKLNEISSYKIKREKNLKRSNLMNEKFIDVNEPTLKKLRFTKKEDLNKQLSELNENFMSNFKLEFAKQIEEIKLQNSKKMDEMELKISNLTTENSNLKTEINTLSNKVDRIEIREIKNTIKLIVEYYYDNRNDISKLLNPTVNIFSESIKKHCENFTNNFIDIKSIKNKKGEIIEDLKNIDEKNLYIFANALNLYVNHQLTEKIINATIIFDEILKLMDEYINPK